jgi:hypothetical protein
MLPEATRPRPAALFPDGRVVLRRPTSPLESPSVPLRSGAMAGGARYSTVRGVLRRCSGRRPPTCRLKDRNCRMLAVDIGTRHDLDTVPLRDSRDRWRDLQQQLSRPRVARWADLGTMCGQQDVLRLTPPSSWACGALFRCADSTATPQRRPDVRIDVTRSPPRIASACVSQGAAACTP